MMRAIRSLAVAAAVALAARTGETARPSPAFTLLRLGTTPLRLSQYRGKVVALAFIQTTCPHCQQLTTELNLIARDYAKRGVQIVECAFNDGAAAAMPEFLERFSPPFPVGYSNLAAVMAYLQIPIIDPRPVYVPYMVFIDRGGVIRAEYGGESPFFQYAGASVRGQLDKMLGK
jgi:thiol-disulfide isomerase/thioredoxin